MCKAAVSSRADAIPDRQDPGVRHGEPGRTHTCVPLPLLRMSVAKASAEDLNALIVAGEGSGTYTSADKGPAQQESGETPKEVAAEEEEEVSAALFSTRRPKDLGAGAASGAKTIVKGVLAGAIGLVAAPMMGMREDGVKGFVKGMGMGVAGAVALPVAGTIVGCVQMARGALNTPEAIKERRAGKVWDEDSRQVCRTQPDLEMTRRRKRRRAKRRPTHECACPTARSGSCIT